MTNDKINVLVVDDLPEQLLVLKSVLAELGQNVITVRTGAEALRQVLEHDFAVILLDVNMPEMDGFETAGLIRQRKKSAHTPIIFITAYADEMHAAQGYSLGAVDYILSPVVPEVLRTKVKVFVDLFRMAQRVERQADERVALAREQAARAAAEEATRRSGFLAEASKVLASSLDYEATLRGFLRLVVPVLGDLCALTFLDEQGRTSQEQRAWIDPANQSWQCGVPVREQWHGPMDDAVQRVLANAKAEYLPALGLPGPAAAAETLVQNGRSGEPGPHFEFHAALVFPLLARGQALGTLVLAMGPSGRSYSADDRALAEDLAGRAAVALDNARLYRNIQEADRRKNEFLAMLAHELRNPLAPIRNAVEILRLGGADPQVVAKTSGLIENQVHQLVRLVDDLLDISRITRGMIRLQKEAIRAATVIERAVETSRPVLDARAHVLEVSVPDEPIWLEGDPVRLAQILGNLLNNAAKYTEPGGNVWLSVERQNGEVVFSVRDSGMGIPPDKLSTIFELFTQVERSLDRSQGGLGIGLTLVRNLVEMHGGSVRAYSDGLKKGSEFVVRLPVLTTEEHATPSIPETTITTEKCPRRRILVAEDEPISAMSFECILQMEGHEVVICHDGPAALEAAETFRPEIVLLDIGLPGMDGYKVARRLRERPAGQNILLVALTGYGQEEDRRRSREAGFDHHLVKPVDHKVLKSLFVSHCPA
jgi:signal transduction histidine kinase/DNA-binding response OmpR family regulator